MKKLFFVIAASCLFAFSALAHESGKCTSASCKCLTEGICGGPSGRAQCIVTITAPSLTPDVTLDMQREDGTSRFDKGARRPDRVVARPDGSFTVIYWVGCPYASLPTTRAYMCAKKDEAEGFPGAASIRHRDDLDAALATRKLEMCLLGENCPRFTPGPPPR
jgi:hypothetical protein